MLRRGRARRFRRLAAAILTAAVVPPAGGAAAAQEPAGWAAPDDAEPPHAIHSLGQPPRWKPFVGLGFGADAASPARGFGATASAWVYRDVVHPQIGLLGYSLGAYAGQRGADFDAGLRAYVGAPALFFHGGVDWDARRRRADVIVSAQVPAVRGGWFGRGGEVRVDYVPARNHRLVLGAALPVAQPLVGRTRPRHAAVPLPAAPAAPRASPPPAGAPEAEALADLHETLGWILVLHNIYWYGDRGRIDHEATVTRSRRRLAEVRRDLDRRAAAAGASITYAGQVAHYHDALERTFGLALGETEPDGRLGGLLAARARRAALHEIVLPYNRTVGQHKRPDRLDGLIARARARFIGELLLGMPLPEPELDASLRVFDAWLASFEMLRARKAGITGDPRMHWLPMALVLRPDEHGTQERVDALVATALGTGFTGGNTTLYINAPQFQAELDRTIHETEDYHVLWVHDFRGRDRHDPDTVAFARAANGYLRALLDNVRAYDRTGRLPRFILMVDQHYYALRGGRLWLDLLERPLTHRVRVADPRMRRTIEAIQDSLRSAVAASARMRAEAAAYGADWPERVVKVHVNVTYPADFTFRSRRILGSPFDSDNMMRDHRKLVIRDVTAADPGRGEVIVTGAAVGDEYATRWWDDRGLVITGPAALTARDEARIVLESHGLRGPLLPPPLRPESVPPDYAARVAALERTGATARVLQAHNRTGFDDKRATFVQMLLYDLAPAGTVLFVPNSLWTNWEWMAQLVSAALRGCRVYIVATSARHNPHIGFWHESITQELVTQLVLVREQFGDAIRDAGGELRIGIYTRGAPAGDLPARIAEVQAGYARYPFLGELFPLPAESWTALRRIGEGGLGGDGGSGRPDPAGEAGEPGAIGAPGGSDGAGEEGEPVMMHRKTQLLASADALRGLAGMPAFAAVLAALLRHEAEAVVPPESGPLAAQARLRPFLGLLDHYRSAPEAERAGHVLYLMVGSLNSDVRSMALDGEVHAVVAGEWALQAYLDFFLMSGNVRWVENLEEADSLLPPLSNWRRRVARILEPLI